MFRSLPISLLVTTAILAVAAPAANAVSYITVDGIKGTVAFNAPNAAAGGGSAGKVHYSDLTMTVHLAKSTPLLNLALADGEHFDALEFTFRAPTAPARAGDPQDYMTFTLENVLVSGYQTSAKEISFTVTGTGKTMAAEVLASALGHAGAANLLLTDGSVRFIS